MRQKLTRVSGWAGLASLWIAVVAMGFLGLGLLTASAQTSSPQIVRSAGNKTPVVTSGAG
jgi:hypothetical protein